MGLKGLTLWARVGRPHALQEGLPTKRHRTVAPSRKGRRKSSFHVGAFSLARTLLELEFTPEPLTVARRRRRILLLHYHLFEERYLTRLLRHHPGLLR